jgi:hypothetical protein
MAFVCQKIMISWRRAYRCRASFPFGAGPLAAVIGGPRHTLYKIRSKFCERKNHRPSQVERRSSYASEFETDVLQFSLPPVASIPFDEALPLDFTGANITIVVRAFVHLMQMVDIASISIGRRNAVRGHRQPETGRSVSSCLVVPIWYRTPHPDVARLNQQD